MVSRNRLLTLSLTIILLTACGGGGSGGGSQQACEGISLQNVPNTPIDLVMPFTIDTEWFVGGVGSFYGQGGHNGEDFFATDWNMANNDSGEPVFPVAEGEVTNISGIGDLGWHLTIGHANPTSPANPLRTVYAHLQENPDIYVDVGDSVTIHTQIGRVGSTGNSTGPHLHLSFQIMTLGQWQAGPKPSPMWTTAGFTSLATASLIS